MGVGIIYAILDDEYFYIGSTTKSMFERMYNHENDSKTKKMKLYKYINEIGKKWSEIIYITLEEIECSEEELREKEYEYIKKHIKDEGCLNVVQNDRHKYIINNYMKKRHNK